MEIPKELIEVKNNKIIFESRIYYQYNINQTNNQINYIDYMCRIHRKNETKNKDKKLCYGKIRLKHDNNNQIFYYITAHTEYCNKLNYKDIQLDILSKIENNIENLSEYNSLINYILNVKSTNKSIKNNIINNSAPNNLFEEPIENNININKEEIKILQDKLKEYCISNKPTSLQECREFVNVNYKDYKHYIIKNPNIIKNIYYRYINTSSSLDLNLLKSNSKTIDDNLFFRELIYFQDISDESKNILIGIIYATNKNINRLAAAEHWYLDGTFIHPPGFRQILLIMYLDIITNKTIPGVFCLLNSKKEILYSKVLDSVKNIITSNNNIEINLKSVTLDFERGLNNSFIKYFPNIHIVGCLYHYKQILLRKLKKYGLYDKSYKNISNEILQKAGKLPFIIHSNKNSFKDFINYLSEQNDYIDFKNYFERKWKDRIKENGTLDYYLISKDQRSNSMLENYNGRLIKKYGKLYYNLIKIYLNL